ncbi:hypothetical protein C9374_003574 [Naegleria lovaniensis]|uniref:CRIB domain-containing protein n=1 Tax=Naegleria lovaniensis TaxID=51637 RepID=A0AA88H363_NAELO|nr:uncharacterized protein C9374_003574 [Naegleria lovaniensis]KAG2393810.1 hypothetical protein C9374_003574 [Naegleria lovaniensis]
MSIDKDLNKQVPTSSFEQANSSQHTLSKNIVITPQHHSIRLPSPPSLTTNPLLFGAALQKATTCLTNNTSQLVLDTTVPSSAMIIPSNSVLLQKRLEILAPSDDQSSSSDDEEEQFDVLTSGSSVRKQRESSEKEAANGDSNTTAASTNRSRRADSFLSWFSWLSWYSNSNNSSNNSDLNENNQAIKTLNHHDDIHESTHHISAPFAFEHRIHIDKDPSSNSSSGNTLFHSMTTPSTCAQCSADANTTNTNTSNSLMTDISLTVFEQRERIHQLERENELKNEYICELEKKIREMHEKKLRSREKYHKLKDKYEKLRDFAFGGSGVVTETSSTSPPTLPYLTTGSSATTMTMKRNHQDGVSSTPELDALLEKMQLQED